MCHHKKTLNENEGQKMGANNVKVDLRSFFFDTFTIIKIVGWKIDACRGKGMFIF